MVHGLRNDNNGAVNKIIIAQNRLRHLGYKHPVIGFSYDSNVKGAHLSKCARHVLQVGQLIAKKNGKNLAKFIDDFKKQSPSTKIRLIGHSLGSQVILSTIFELAKKNNSNMLESVHFFGSSISNNTLSSKNYSKILNKTINSSIVNYYAPSDEVLFLAHKENLIQKPIGLYGYSGNPIPKYLQKKVKPKNHRFASYALTLKSFP